MRTILKKIVIVFIIILILTGYLAQSFYKVDATTGQTSKAAGETIAAWCEDFFTKHQSQTRYENHPLRTHIREQTYSMGVSDNDLTSIYQFDCVGFVSFAIHHAVGFGTATWQEMVLPISCKNPIKAGFDKITTNKNVDIAVSNNEILPGDVVVMGTHVAIYVGNGYTMGMYKDIHGSLVRLKIASDCAGCGGYAGYVCRLKEEVVAGLDFTYKVGAGLTGTSVSNCSTDKGSDMKAGDHSGKEYKIADWKNKTDDPFTAVFRYNTDPAVQQEIATQATLAAQNDHIGYSSKRKGKDSANENNYRETFLEEAKKVNYDISQITTDCAADCSSSTATILIIVGNKLNIESFKNLGLFNTGNEESELLRIGFEKLDESKYITQSDYLSPGDILLSAGHSEIFVGGVASGASAPVDNVVVDLDTQEFLFSGNPKKMAVLGYKKTGFWTFSGFADFIDYLIGTLTIMFRYSLLGWSSAYETIMDNGLKRANDPVDMSKAPSTNETTEEGSSTTTTTESGGGEASSAGGSFDSGVGASSHSKSSHSSETVTDEEEDTVKFAKEDEDKVYSLEKIIFGQVPVLDVNFFSDKAGGEPVKSGSMEEVIRTSIAGWYVSFRNIAIVALAILLIYYGIRMAISTIASQKAEFKQMLLIWLKSMILLFLMNYIIYFVLYLNQWFIDILYKAIGDADLSSMYTLIKTRSYDIRFSIGTPAIIMYISLLIIWTKFIFAYIKRLFRVVLYIILAPLVIAKYAFDSASGKSSKTFTNWLQKFTTQVFIQSIHCVVYVVFIKTAIQISTENVLGFILALVFMNFMLSADDIFVNIFNFDASEVKNMKKPFRPKSQFDGAFLAYGVTKKLGKVTIGGVKTVGGDLFDAAGDIYHGSLSTLSRNGITKPQKINDSLVAGVHNIYDAIDDKLIDLTSDKVNLDGTTKTRGKATKEIRRIIILRKNARTKNGTAGIRARKTLKLKKKLYKKAFTSEFKYVKGIVTAGVSTVLVIPLAVAGSGDLSKLAFSKGLEGITSAAAIRKDKKLEKLSKDNDKLNDVISGLSTANSNLAEIEKALNKLSKEEKKEKIEALKKYQSVGVNTVLLTSMVQSQIENSNIDQTDTASVQSVVNSVVDNFAGELSDADKAMIKSIARKLIESRKNKFNENKTAESENKFTFTSNDIAEDINKGVKETMYGTDKPEIVDALDKVNSQNQIETNKKDSFGNLVNVNRFLDNL